MAVAPIRRKSRRPGARRVSGAYFYAHDGNKNVSEVFYYALGGNGIAAHYDYAPFGAVTATGARALTNPFRFSSEFYDDTLGLVYYNYRHYNPKDGRWLGRDCSEKYGVNLYVYIGNTISQNDILGLIERTYVQRVRENIANCSEICPKMANWEAGLAYLDSLLLSDGGKNYLDSVGESLNLVLDVISTGETAKDVWNVLTETMSEELRIGITFEEIKKPLSKIRDRIAFMNIVQKLKTVDMLSSAEQIRLLGDILDVSRMPEIPILDEYFGGTFGVVEEALENIETVYTDYRYRDLSVFEDCAALKNYLYGSGRLGSTEILSRLLKKTP